MSAKKFQIRVCPSCGLRYPTVEADGGSQRCPVCLSDTTLVMEKSFEIKPVRESRALSEKVNLCVILDNLRSAWNVGSIFRSADGFEFGHLYLCGITPTPENADVRKTALGAEQIVNWSCHRNAMELIKILQDDGLRIWALEYTLRSKPIESVLFTLEPTSDVNL